MTIGEKLKKSRNDKGMSLRELATKVELSASFLSQIEQGKASPSIENLKKIAHTLDVRVAYLIEDEEDDIRNIEHIKKENIKYIESLDSNIKMGILLSNNREKNMEPIIYEIGVDGESGRDFYSHGSSEEFIYILEGELEVYVANKKYKLEGELEVYVANKKYKLSKGDSLYFKSSLKHRFKNTSKKEVKALWVVSPPTF